MKQRERGRVEGYVNSLPYKKIVRADTVTSVCLAVIVEITNNEMRYGAFG